MRLRGTYMAQQGIAKRRFDFTPQPYFSEWHPAGEFAVTILRHAPRVKLLIR